MVGFRKPLLIAIAFIGVFMVIAFSIYLIFVPIKETERLIGYLGQLSILLICVIGSVLSVLNPNYVTGILLIARSIICLLFCYINYLRFYGKKMCDKSAEEQIKHNHNLYDTMQLIVDLYVLTNLFLIPFCDNFFRIFTGITLVFAVELTFTNFVWGYLWVSLIQVT
jgi:hypothetical protein